MVNKKLIQIGGILSILTGVLMTVWWVLMGILLPQSAAKDNFDVIINHANWIPINIIGFAGALAWSISFFMIFLINSNKLKIRGIVGFIIGEIGIIWFTCIQYYETFIWPVIGKYDPNMIKIDGALVFGDSTLIIPLILSGLFLGIGYVLICIEFLKENIFPKKVIWMLLIGVLVFGNGLIIGIRTIGLLLLVIALFQIGEVIIGSV